MPTSKELREKTVPLAKQIRAMTDAASGRDFTPEEQGNWDKVNADYNSLKRDIERLEATEAIECEQAATRPDRAKIGREDYDPRTKKDNATTATDEHRAMALQAWCAHQMGRDLSEAQQEACRLTGVKPHARELALSTGGTQHGNAIQRAYRSAHHTESFEKAMQYKAALSIGLGTAGGYLIPPETLIRTLEVNMLAFGGVRQVAETIQTASGEPLSWPTADDTTNTGAQLGESTTIGSSTDPTFGKVLWSAYKFSSKPVLVPFELLEDSAFDLPGTLGTMLGERLGRITNTRYTTGTGAATSKGIVTCSTAGKTAASATAIAADELIDLEHSIDPAYRTLGCSWMMHDLIVAVLRKLKDGNGQYLWQSGLETGRPDAILGYPITINQDMQSTVATATKTILFGQLSKYKIRRVNQIRMYRLEERYRDTDQDGFIAFVREDGNMLTAGTQPIKHLLQA